MRQNLVKQAENILQQRKLNAEHAFNVLMRPVFEDKDYVKLEKEKTQIIIENAKQEADGKKPDAKKLVQIDEKIEKIKEKYGLSGKKIEYGCNFCLDNGYIDGHMCKCLKKEILEMIQIMGHQLVKLMMVMVYKKLHMIIIVILIKLTFRLNVDLD